MISDLLDIADELARRDPTRPKSASLRRAVSSSYYALFHALSSLCASGLVGWSKPWNVFSPVYRALEHGHAKRTLLAFQKSKARASDLDLVVSAFTTLQDERYKADYSPEPFLNRDDTMELVTSARRAVDAIGRLSAETKLELAVRLIVKSRSGADQRP